MKSVTIPLTLRSQSTCVNAPWPGADVDFKVTEREHEKLRERERQRKQQQI